MKNTAIVWTLLMAGAATVSFAQNSNGPTSEKAQKTYKEGIEYLHQRRTGAALDCFKKADKQDDGHCLKCEQQMVKYGVQLHEWKAAETGAEEMVAQAKTPREVALAHYQFGVLWLNEGRDRNEKYFNGAHQELLKALAVDPGFAQAALADGQALGYLKQDDAAKARFEQWIKTNPEEGAERQRVERYIEQPELVRARMAPPFEVTTLDGQRISLDDLEGKVVLIDFWATWCGPCREALPHVKEIAKKFQGQPLVVLSISVDSNQAVWKEFVAKNEMTWPQYFDGGFTGSVAKSFGVQAIPHTFTIDSDGILQDEHIGDASIEGKLKKLVKRAQEAPPVTKPAVWPVAQ